jgi:GAF domain-containing protein
MHSDDVSEKKQSCESDLGKLNLIVTVLRQCHRALLQPVDETFLLCEICRILVTQAGYRLCWFGFSDDGDPDRLRMAACHGTDAWGVSIGTISWEETGLDSAASMERALTANHLYGLRLRLSAGESWLSGEPWREAALKKGIQSVLYLPLKSDGQTVAAGIMAIYSVDPAGFSDDETLLLSLLAQDIAKSVGCFLSLTDRNKRPGFDSEAESCFMDHDDDSVFQNAVLFFEH